MKVHTSLTDPPTSPSSNKTASLGTFDDMAELPSNGNDAPTSTTPSHSDGDTDVFQFLDLPRELRDAVYDLVCADDIALKPQREFQWDIDDYMGIKSTIAALKPTTLVLSDTPLYHREYPFLFRIKNVQAAQRCKIVMLNRCNKDRCVGEETDCVENHCILLYELDRMVDTVEALAKQLPQSTPISVCIGMWRDAVAAVWPNCTHVNQGMQEWMDVLTGINRVSRVEVFKYTAPIWSAMRSSPWGPSIWSVTEETDLDDLWATWTREDGWMSIPSERDDTH
ncbi:uncharacterized protein RHO25_006951 [Cercospora beticola]|uniref:Uncharacterized protein n=1 Tax=Cercospora beticola TaxID=122368 RepID=A0ABZ0NRX1_CERBT|nr:hypothetical protein RHO25_006951 [Cercospora beticola]